MKDKPIKSITVAESLITYISLGWAYVMLTNSEIFERSENFNQLEILVHSEWIVGIICLILASIKIFGNILKNKRVRWLGLILSALFWICVSASFLISDTPFSLNTGFIVYAGIAVLSLHTSKEVMLDD